MFATQPLGRASGKSQRAFSFKCDGLLPSCVSPPPLPLGWPRRPGPSDPSSAGLSFRLRADEGLQPKTWADCAPLKAAGRQWAGRSAPGSPLPRPLGSRAPRTPAKLTSRPRVGPNHTPLGQPRARPPLPRPRNPDSRQAQPTTPLLSSLVSYPNPREKKWEGVTRDACLATALWE